MSQGKVSIWRLSKEQITAYVPGMDLGNPDSIVSPASITNSEEGLDEEKEQRMKRAHAGRMKGKPALSEELYKKHKEDGMSDAEIAMQYSIRIKTITGYRSLWKQRKGL